MHYNSYQCCPLLLWAPSLSKSDRLSFLACIYVTIKLQSSPAHFGKFWRHSTNREAKSISNAFGHFVFRVLKIRINETPFLLGCLLTHISYHSAGANCASSFMRFFCNTSLILAEVSSSFFFF